LCNDYFLDVASFFSSFSRPSFCSLYADNLQSMTTLFKLCNTFTHKKKGGTTLGGLEIKFSFIPHHQ
jgi:hypothetical protein